MASGPDDDPLMSVVIDAALAHLVESNENIQEARNEYNPVTIQGLCNTSLLGLRYRTRIKELVEVISCRSARSRPQA